MIDDRQRVISWSCFIEEDSTYACHINIVREVAGTHKQKESEYKNINGPLDPSVQPDHQESLRCTFPKVDQPLVVAEFLPPD